MTFAPGDVPPRAGIGFKHAHAEALLADPGRVGFVEIHAENYMGAGGPPHRALAAVREVLPLSLHGVGLSIGAEAGLDPAHLARLVAVAERTRPGLVSEHLAWSTHEGAYFNDLLPLPYTDRVLDRVARHVDEVQTALGRTMLLENPSRYAAFEASTMSETAFLSRLVAMTGCGLILDVNNVAVSAANLGFAAEDYLGAFPLAAVGEIHLAGHREDAAGDLLIDTHDGPVSADVWSLYRNVVETIGRPLPTLIEWDAAVPPFDTLAAEAERAEAILTAVRAREAV
ncbi:MNIO family bufferin maturase [Acuticoccus mangrovi]|uniref:UPF0276 protein JCR33_06995 n=1 Tax=Acuticoccus mangrovi TaxID=2796142 RepID=A0A934II54_9HYPH|nr:DUF692 domain-containing protein [Acuticoccus mangrovi]MBJ3775426.1 DUF692 domain-containing protein [Acuticoccus mangrovi]